MDTMDKDFKMLLKECLEKKMSVDTILQIVNLSEFSNWDKISIELMEIIDTASERQLREKISKIIEN